MDSDLLGTLGRIAGIAGIAVGALVLVFRDILGKAIFPKLTRAQAFRLLSLIVFSVWSLAILAIVYPQGDGADSSLEVDPSPSWTGLDTRHEEPGGIVLDILSRDHGVVARPEDLNVRDRVGGGFDFRYEREGEVWTFSLTRDERGGWNVESGG